jgi:hypothetical protein
MWLGVALCGVHLRLPWPGVAWRRLVPAHLGSPPGSQSSLAPLIFEAPGYPATPGQPPAQNPDSRGPALPGNGADRAASRPGHDEADVDPGSLGRRLPAAGTGGEDVITVGGQAHHDGIDRTAVGQQHSRPAAIGHHDCATRLAGQSPVRHRRWRVIEIRQTSDCMNRNDPLPSSPALLTDDRSCMM